MSHKYIPYSFVFQFLNCYCLIEHVSKILKLKDFLFKGHSLVISQKQGILLSGEFHVLLGCHLQAALGLLQIIWSLQVQEQIKPAYSGFYALGAYPN